MGVAGEHPVLAGLFVARSTLSWKVEYHCEKVIEPWWKCRLSCSPRQHFGQVANHPRIEPRDGGTRYDPASLGLRGWYLWHPAIWRDTAYRIKVAGHSVGHTRTIAGGLVVTVFSVLPAGLVLFLFSYVSRSSFLLLLSFASYLPFVVFVGRIILRGVTFTARLLFSSSELV